MYQGVETPRGPMYQGVAIVDLLMIQNSPKYRGVETPQCPMYQGVKTPRCPMYRGVETPRCPMYRGVETLRYFVSQNSPVSYVPGS